MATDYRQKVVDLANSFVGVGEPDGDDQFIEYYNSVTGSKFSVDTTPWCAIFVTFIARKCNIPTSVIPNFASCTTSRDSFFKPKGRWHDAGSYNPKYGDLIYWDWDGSGNCDHVGYVTDNDGTYVYTADGNSKGGTNVYGVRNHKYKLTDSDIIGYAEPDYDSIEGNSSSSDIIEVELDPNDGVFVNGVKEFQSWLNWYTDAGLIIDGSCGPLTKTAVVKAIQTILNNNFGASLDVDGSYGPLTKAAAELIQYCCAGSLVYIAQGLLYGHNIDPKDFSGIYGKDTENAIKTFQSRVGISSDGQCGIDTWYHLNKTW